jgi:hypothetical protein
MLPKIGCGFSLGRFNSIPPHIVILSHRGPPMSRLLIGLILVLACLLVCTSAARGAAPEVKIENVEVWSEWTGTAAICWTTPGMAETGVVEYGEQALDQKTKPSNYLGQNHRVILSGLNPAKTYRARILGQCEGRKIVSEPFQFRAAPPVPPPTRSQTIALAVPEPTRHARRNWPTTIGVPFAKSSLAKTDDLRLTDPAGKPVTLQASSLSHWPDGSVSWAVLDFLATTQTDSCPATYTLHAKSRQEDKPVKTAIKVAQVPEMKIGDVPLIMELMTGDGVLWKCGPPDQADTAVEVDGPMRSVRKFTGPMIAPDGTKAWRYLVRLTTYPGHSTVGLDVSLCNDQQKPRTREIKSWTLRLPVGGQNVQAAMQSEPLAPLKEGQSLHLLQDNDNHYTLHTPYSKCEASHATGLVRVAGEKRQWTVVMPRFWQTYPAGLKVRPATLEVELLPQLTPDAYSDPESKKLYHRLYAWFFKGNYLLRAGQLVRRQLFIVPEALSDQQATHWQAWCSRPLLPQAPPKYLCGTGTLGRVLYTPTADVFSDYELMFERNSARYLENRQQNRTFGFMHFGDWFGERGLNYGNNEYDVAWGLAVQWMRTGRRDYFDTGLEMAHHYTAIDTQHGDFTKNFNGLVFEHSFNHVGTDLSPQHLQMPTDSPGSQRYLKEYGKDMFRGYVDPQGHIFQEGNWLYAALTGDPFLWEVAERVCENQALRLTQKFDFGIARGGGWPIANAAAAYRHTGNPYYLNAARLMVQRTLERQHPANGGWYYYMPLNETYGMRLQGCKPFTVGILTYGMLRYLDVEPKSRPDVRRSLVRAADWLRRDAWVPGEGLRTATIEVPPEAYQRKGERGDDCLLNAELVAFAYEETQRQEYLDFWRDLMKGMLADRNAGMGKNFAQMVHQTIFGLDRIRPWIANLPPDGDIRLYRNRTPRYLRQPKGMR